MCYDWSTEQAVFHCMPYLPFNFQDLIINSPFWLPHISLLISYKNLVFDQGNNFSPISLSILITCFAGKCLEIIGRSYMLITSGV